MTNYDYDAIAAKISDAATQCERCVVEMDPLTDADKADRLMKARISIEFDRDRFEQLVEAIIDSDRLRPE